MKFEKIVMMRPDDHDAPPSDSRCPVTDVPPELLVNLGTPLLDARSPGGAILDLSASWRMEA